MLCTQLYMLCVIDYFMSLSTRSILNILSQQIPGPLDVASRWGWVTAWGLILGPFTHFLGCGFFT